MTYSHLFHTLHDEKEPYGTMGRGTHYSVFSAAQWFNYDRKLIDGGKANVQRFAIVWDEDHDDRVVSLAEKAYMAGIFAPVLFIGERKAHLSVVVADEFYQIIQKDWASYNIAWADLASDVFGDVWNFDQIVPMSHAADSGIIASHPGHVTTYLQNIHNLWNIGSHKYIAPLTSFAPPGWAVGDN